MKKTILAAIAGAAFLLPLQSVVQSGAQAAANTPQVRECVRQIALQERNSARQTKGNERRALIAALGKGKIACMSGQIDQAYAAAAKLKLDPQQATAN